LANAIDIGGFVLADGRTVGVLKGWGPTERDIAAQAKAAAKAKASDEKPGQTAQKGPASQMAQKEKVTQASITSLEGPASLQKKSAQAAGLPATKAAVPAKPTKEAQFLRAIHDGACREFGTVIGPEANDPHRNHFHLDLIARRGRGYCE
jgi:hypothetical protein